MELAKCYEMGAKARARGIENKWEYDGPMYLDFLMDELGHPKGAMMKMAICEIYGDASCAKGLHFLAGLEGRPMPKKVRGYRYGGLPPVNKITGTRCSWNYREDKSEMGVSMAAIEGCKEIFSFAILGCIDEGRPKVYCEGYLSWISGGDSEPLLVAAKEIPEYLS